MGSVNVPAYIDAIETVDAHVAEVLSALTSRPNYAEKIGSSSPPQTTVALVTGTAGNPSTSRSSFSVPAGSRSTRTRGQRHPRNSSPTRELCGTRRCRTAIEGNGDAVHIARVPCYPSVRTKISRSKCASAQKPPPTLPSLATRTGIPDSTPDLSSPSNTPTDRRKVNIGDGDNRADANGSAGFGRPMAHAVVLV